MAHQLGLGLFRSQRTCRGLWRRISTPSATGTPAVASRTAGGRPLDNEKTSCPVALYELRVALYELRGLLHELCGPMP